LNYWTYLSETFQVQSYINWLPFDMKRGFISVIGVSILFAVWKRYLFTNWVTLFHKELSSNSTLHEILKTEAWNLTAEQQSYTHWNNTLSIVFSAYRLVVGVFLKTLILTSNLAMKNHNFNAIYCIQTCSAVNPLWSFYAQLSYAMLSSGASMVFN